MSADNEIQFPEAMGFLLFEPAYYKVLYGGRGAGKCLGLGTKVIMYDGTLKAVEDVKVNDLLMGPDSLPRKVLGTTRGWSELYKVKQTSGIDYIVNSAHILSLKKSKSALNDIGEISKAGFARRPNGRYGSYPLITNINVVEAYNKSKRWKEHFRGYKAGLIEFKKQSILIDPWYLGLWLGDGNSTDTIVTTNDPEILEGCEKYAKSLGMRLSFYENKGNCVSVRITRNFGGKGSGKENILRQAFIVDNLFNNKHIPLNYLTNIEEVRLQILAGLIDSDGYCHNNGYEITQTNEKLAKDIKYLADTLGFRTNIREKKTSCQNGVEGLAYRVTINGDTWRIPCRVQRKIIKKENVKKNKDFLLSQIEIEPMGMGEYAGFSLDGDHLFLLEDGTVTHNTENIARALIIFARAMKLRIACFRDIQKSIDESVISTLKACIVDMGFDNEFDVQRKRIIHKITGSEFLFLGLRHNINTIKSLARIDIAWVEEAVTVNKTSWEKLEPTIRGRHKDDPNGLGGPFGKGPEIWISFNPELDTDETYQRYIVKRDIYAPDFIQDEETGEQIRFAFVKKVNWSDNKWFPDDLRMKMRLLKEKNEDEWLHVWEGNTKQVLDGAIYAKEIKKVLLENRRGKVPYDPSRPVHTFWDLGHDDHTSIWFVQQVGVHYNLIGYFQDRLQKIPYYLEYLQSLKYVYGKHYLPHDANNETLASRSVFKMVNDVYPKQVLMVPRPPQKIVGIRAARVVFDLCNFDEENTADGWQCLCRYQYDVDDNGKFSLKPLHNEFSNGADAFQTFALHLKTETASKKKEEKTLGVGRRPMFERSSNSWMGG